MRIPLSWVREYAPIDEATEPLEVSRRLTAAGLVTRHRRVEDERSVSIALTDACRSLENPAYAFTESMIGAIGFDSGEFNDLMGRLRLLTERVQQGQAATSSLG